MKTQISYPIDRLLKMFIYTALFSERDKCAYVLIDLDYYEYMSDKDNYTQYNEAFQVIYDTLHSIGIEFFSDFDVIDFRYKFLYEWKNTPENVSKIIEQADILLELFKRREYA